MGGGVQQKAHLKNKPYALAHWRKSLADHLCEPAREKSQPLSGKDMQRRDKQVIPGA